MLPMQFHHAIWEPGSPSPHDYRCSPWCCICLWRISGHTGGVQRYTDISESVLGLDVQVLISLLLTAPGTVDRLSANPFSIATKQSLAW